MPGFSAQPYGWSSILNGLESLVSGEATHHAALRHISLLDYVDLAKNRMFLEKDFRNSKFCVKKKLSNVTLNQENLKFRHKFLK